MESRAAQDQLGHLGSAVVARRVLGAQAAADVRHRRRLLELSLPLSARLSLLFLETHPIVAETL
jgi:hypothetical protein